MHGNIPNWVDFADSVFSALFEIASLLRVVGGDYIAMR